MTLKHLRSITISGCLIMLIVSAFIVQAQDSTQYDRGTPPQHAAGVSSLGSYISTDLGTINLS